jgi:ankyrin repeat protein
MGSGASLSGVAIDSLSGRDVAGIVSTIIPGQGYDRIMLKHNIDGRKLHYISCAEASSVTQLLNNYGISNQQHQDKLVEELQKAASKSVQGESLGCTHHYLEKWEGVYHCMDCKVNITDPERIKSEIEIENKIESLLQSKQDDSSTVIEDTSHLRGVKIGWLVEWTNTHQCWNMPTWKVRREFIIPETAFSRCRYTELPCMMEEGIVGPAATFISHTWGANFGDLVAAVSDGADRNRYVWIDIFAVRQWPSSIPDLDFAGTIRRCQSFVLVCSSLPQVQKLTTDMALSRRKSNLSGDIRKQIAFFRVWCLVEIQAAADMARDRGMAIIMKCGSSSSDGRFISSDRDMLWKLEQFVDIRNADASVKSDKDRILADVSSRPNGTDGLNQAVRGIMAGARSCSSNPGILCAACGDANAIDQLLLDPNTSLLNAAAAGFLGLIDHMLSRGVEVDARDSKRMTALMMASAGGHEACVEALGKLGADSNAIDCNNQSVLMWAAQGGHLSCVEILIRLGARVNSHDSNGRTALAYAAESGHLSCIKLLVRYGASVSVVDDDGWTTVIIAAMAGHLECMEYLVTEGVSVNGRGKDGITALMMAAKGGHYRCLEFLHKCAATVDVKASSGLTALAFAAIGGHIKCIQLLCTHGANIRTTDNEGRTVVMHAARGGHTLCARALITRGVRINQRDSDNWTAWKYAFKYNHRECVKALEELGAEETGIMLA